MVPCHAGGVSPLLPLTAALVSYAQWQLPLNLDNSLLTFQLHVEIELVDDVHVSDDCY